MANAIQKIVLSGSRDIPFNKLVLSQSNVRRMKAGISIEELAEDIARRTLLQSLSVRPVLDAEGQETGMFEIPAGGRRFRALELLVKQKRLAKNAPVPCVVREGGLAKEDSLAENVQRVALHPLDQFRAFQALREKGLGDDDIAARFFVTPTVVKQRLRLAAVSSTLLDVYAEDGMTLEQLMAFTVTNDHARQEQVWEAISRTYNKEAYYIRRQITEGAVKALDRRARFVGVEAYEAAGGVVLRDLFQTDDDGGWLQDPALLDRLVIEKLQAEAEALRPEGWKWIAIAADFPYGHTAGLRRLTGEAIDFTEKETASLEALRAEYEAIETQYADADELPDEADQRLGEIEAAIAALEERPLHYDPAEIARAGVFVSLDDQGTLHIVRGFVRPEDEAPVAPVAPLTSIDSGEAETTAPGGSVTAAPQTIIAIGGVPTGGEPEASEEEDVLRPLSDRLVTELTAHRTLALRNSLANDPEVALQAVLHALCLSVLPTTPADLWDVLAGLDAVSRANLLAHCASLTVNVVKEPWNRRPDAMAHGDTLARAVHLDLAAAGWRPTVDNYLGRVPKARILDAVREAKGEQSAQLIDHLKKGDMASEAARLLDGAGWLPEPLRLAEIETVEQAQAEEPDALPDFLAGEDDEAATDEPDEPQPHSLAAE